MTARIVSLWGGPRDGTRLAIPVPLEVLNFPVPVDSAIAFPLDPDEPVVIETTTIVYRRTSSFTSYGARVYEYVPTRPDNENPTTEGTQNP